MKQGRSFPAGAVLEAGLARMDAVLWNSTGLVLNPGRRALRATIALLLGA